MHSNDSTEFLLNNLKTSIHALRLRMAEEVERFEADPSKHYHFVIAEVNTCTTSNCAGLDPIKATMDTLLDAAISISRQYRTHRIKPKL